MLGLEGAEVGVERPQREPHDNFSPGLRPNLVDYITTSETGLRSRPIDLHEFRGPAPRLHEIDKRLKALLGARHRWGNRESRHGWLANGVTLHRQCVSRAVLRGWASWDLLYELGP